MYPSSKKLALWLLGSVIGLMVHANYVGGKGEPGGSPQVRPPDPLVMRTSAYEGELEEMMTPYQPLITPQLDESLYPVHEERAPKEADDPAAAAPKGKDWEFHPIIVEVADRHEVDPALIKAIIMAESGYDPTAVSKRGAKGLMQLMPTTAQSLGVEDIFDPEHNIKAGVRYFKKLLNQFDGDVKLALAAYNAGSRKVRKYNGIPPFRATRIYIKKVFKYYELYKERM